MRNQEHVNPDSLLRKSFTLRGRAARSEYWWFVLAYSAVGVLTFVAFFAAVALVEGLAGHGALVLVALALVTLGALALAEFGALGALGALLPALLALLALPFLAALAFVAFFIAVPRALFVLARETSALYVLALVALHALGVLSGFVALALFALGALGVLALAVPFMTVTVRRLHDRGWSGWWVAAGGA